MSSLRAEGNRAVRRVQCTCGMTFESLTVQSVISRPWFTMKKRTLGRLPVEAHLAKAVRSREARVERAKVLFRLSG